MEEKALGNECWTTLVCIDSYQNRVLQGRLNNPAWEGGESFQSLMEFFQKMETLLNQIQLPQSFTAMRSFGETAAAQERDPSFQQAQCTGKLATFVVRVLFRQNASWQGAVTWLEGGQEESFRSALELALLMDSALQKNK